jgi:hypothetical protein
LGTLPQSSGIRNQESGIIPQSGNISARSYQSPPSP